MAILHQGIVGAVFFVELFGGLHNEVALDAVTSHIRYSPLDNGQPAQAGELIEHQQKPVSPGCLGAAAGKLHFLHQTA